MSISMTHPDTGHRSYAYDDNGNLVGQTDADGVTTTLTCDELDRPTGKLYPEGYGMTNVTYTYDSTSGGNFGIGRRTGMTDASGTTTYRYDARGRLVEEKRTVQGVDYVTQYSYDSADRVATTTYPTGEVVTQTYDSRGLPNGLTGSAAGNLVSGTMYNQLGAIKQITLGNGTTTVLKYQGLDVGAPTTYYGRLWQIKTTKDATVLQDLTYTWDANGNPVQRQDVVGGETEDFTYDFLDRLTQVSGAYSQSYAYDELGNITSFNEAEYVYGSRAHAPDSIGGIPCEYDGNGNLTGGGSRSSLFDLENRAVSNESSILSWYTEIDGTGGDTVNRVHLASDNGFILFGTRRVTGQSDVFLLIKTDPFGQKEWEATFASDNATYHNANATCGQITADGGFIMAGYIYSDLGPIDSVAFAVQANSDGNEIWSREYGVASGGQFYDVQETPGGGYVLAGQEFDDYGAWLVKTGSNGNETWSSTLGGIAAYERIWSVCPDGGGYILAGETVTRREGNYEVVLIKADDGGDLVWRKVYYASDVDIAKAVLPASGGYVIVGSTDGQSQETRKVMIMMADGNGNLSWAQACGKGEGQSVVQAAGGGYVLGVAGGGTFGILKTDPDGHGLWMQNFGGSITAAVDKTADDGYIVAGSPSIGTAMMGKVLIVTDIQAYDGDGNRVLNTENGETTLYLNDCYEKNLTTGAITLHYYLGGREVAYKTGDVVTFVHQDSSGSTVATTNSSGDSVATVAYYPFGGTRSVVGNLTTEKLFMGQHLDGSGLYHGGARWYDPQKGIFTRPDTVLQNLADPQTLNPYGRHQYPQAKLAGGAIKGIPISWEVLRRWPGIEVTSDAIINHHPINPSRGGRIIQVHNDGKYGWHLNAEDGLLGRVVQSERFQGHVRLGKYGGAVKPVARNLGRGAVVVGIAIDAYNIGTASAADRESGHGSFGPRTREAVAGAAGGWAGAAAGAVAGAAIGSALPFVGTAAGAFVGGVVGGFGGDAIGRWLF